MTGTRPDCAMCGLPAHRYGISDPHHDYDAIACVNGLRPALDESRAREAQLEAEIRRLQRVLIDNEILTDCEDLCLTLCAGPCGTGGQ